MSDEFIPDGHPLIGIRLGRCSGRPCLAGTRLWTSMIAETYIESYATAGVPLDDFTAQSWALHVSREAHDYIRSLWGDPLHPITDAMIDACVAWEADPDHRRIHRNAIRRQRYARQRAEAVPS